MHLPAMLPELALHDAHLCIIQTYRPVRARRRDRALLQVRAPLDVVLDQDLALAVGLAQRRHLADVCAADAQDAQDLAAGDDHVLAVGLGRDREDG